MRVFFGCHRWRYEKRCVGCWNMRHDKTGWGLNSSLMSRTTVSKGVRWSETEVRFEALFLWIKQTLLVFHAHEGSKGAFTILSPPEAGLICSRRWPSPQCHSVKFVRMTDRVVLMDGSIPCGVGGSNPSDLSSHEHNTQMPFCSRRRFFLGVVNFLAGVLEYCHWL